MGGKNKTDSFTDLLGIWGQGLLINVANNGLEISQVLILTPTLIQTPIPIQFLILVQIKKGDLRKV
jgi:hypothetical protein